MRRRAVLVVARSILVGWVTLIAATIVGERLVLTWVSHFVGMHWVPTAHVAIGCVVLAIVGWVVGRLSTGTSIYAVLAFAATLAPWDLDPLLDFNFPWLIQLGADAFRDPLYIDSLIATATQHVLLLGCLVTGAVLSQPRRMPESLFGRDRAGSAPG